MKVTGGQGGQGGPSETPSKELRGNQRKPLDAASRFVRSAASKRTVSPFFFLFNHRLHRLRPLRRFLHDLRDYSASAVSLQVSS